MYGEMKIWLRLSSEAVVAQHSPRTRFLLLKPRDDGQPQATRISGTL
jgi:hypothetical protein